MAYFKWNGGRASWAVRRALAESMEDLARRLVWRVKHALNVPYPPASSPGEIPRRRTGRLRSSISYDINKHRLIVNVRAGAPYWKYLERGTSKMEARPFLRPVTNAMRPTIKVELARTMKRKLKELL